MEAKGVLMETKVKQTRSGAEAGKKAAFSYIQELKEELKKVTWTTKAELVTCTRIVIGATFAFGLGIYLVDLIIKGVLDGFGALVHMIFG